MKLRKILKQGKKEAKKEEVKQVVEIKPEADDNEEQRDDELVSIKQDIKKKQQSKPKVAKRVETNKLDQVEIDTSKYVVEKKQEVKQQITTWIVEAEKVKDLLKEDFKLNEVETDFESLTDTKLNQELKQKKQKKVQEQKHQAIGQMKFAPISVDSLESKTTDKLTLGLAKPKTETPMIGFTPAPVLNFTNTKLGAGNLNVAPIEKPQIQMYDDDMERKTKERLEQTKKEQTKGGWFKKGPSAPEIQKQAPKIEFKSSPLTFTNTALTGKSEEQQFKGFKPIEKSKQEQIYERKEQEFKFVNKKQQEERRKKRQEEMKQQQTPVETQPKA